MVYVNPTSVQITPSPTSIDTSSVVTVTVTISKNITDNSCNIPYLWTKTNIHLLIKKSSQPWSQAIEIGLIDCTSTCCLTGGGNNIPVTFSPFTFTSPGTYNLMAIDQGYWLSRMYTDLTAIATATITVTPSQSLCNSQPCTPGCATATCENCPELCTTLCASEDYICQMIEFAKNNPIIVVGGLIAVYLLMTPPQRKK